MTRIREKERGYVVDVGRDKKGEAQVGTSGWAIWEFDFSNSSANSEERKE